jgi:hypothetical protein
MSTRIEWRAVPGADRRVHAFDAPPTKRVYAGYCADSRAVPEEKTAPDNGGKRCVYCTVVAEATAIHNGGGVIRG